MSHFQRKTSLLNELHFLSKTRVIYVGESNVIYVNDWTEGAHRGKKESEWPSSTILLASLVFFSSLVSFLFLGVTRTLFLLELHLVKKGEIGYPWRHD